MSDMIVQIFTLAKEALTGTAGLLTDGVQALANVFYTPGVGEAKGSLTILGTALAIGAGCGAIYFLFRLIKGWLSNVKG